MQEAAISTKEISEDVAVLIVLLFDYPEIIPEVLQRAGRGDLNGKCL